MRNPAGLFLYRGVLALLQYPKQILSVEQQLQTYVDAGMLIPSPDDARKALRTIGYYRLRGYCFHLYDSNTKQYLPNTSFSDVLKLYRFDTELSHLLFSLSAAIEVGLRSRLCDALLIHQDALVLHDPQYFSDKKLYWENIGTLSKEIARSNDVFIRHNYDNHEGQIPIWAAVEIMSFGNLSKTIKNLKTGATGSVPMLLRNYQYKSKRQKMVTPSLQMFSSWIQAVSILRNMCAHNSRIYNRTISTHLQIPDIDQPVPQARYNGLYQIILAMKYLRPDDTVWNHFVAELTALFQEYAGVVELQRINFPTDWASHMMV